MPAINTLTNRYPRTTVLHHQYRLQEQGPSFFSHQPMTYSLENESNTYYHSCGLYDFGATSGQDELGRGNDQVTAQHRKQQVAHHLGSFKKGD
jgi:hypothetical protein